jgi:hypothetical protein
VTMSSKPMSVPSVSEDEQLEESVLEDTDPGEPVLGVGISKPPVTW